MSTHKPFFTPYFVSLFLGCIVTFLIYDQFTSKNAHFLLIGSTTCLYFFIHFQNYRSRPKWLSLFASAYFTWMSTLLIFRMKHFSSTGWNFVPIIHSIPLFEHLSAGKIIWYFGGNTLLFIPIGFLFASFTNSTHNSLKIGIACMLCIEIIQGLTGRGVFDIDDLILNMLGIMAGAVCRIAYRKVGQDQTMMINKTVKL